MIPNLLSITGMTRQKTSTISEANVAFIIPGPEDEGK